MKRTVAITLCSLTLITLTGCASKSDKVSDLIEEENYSEAYSMISENPEELKEFRDEVTFNLAKQEAENKNYEKALEYLDGNSFEGAEELKKDATKKQTDKNFLETLAKSLDEYCVIISQEEKVFGPNEYVLPQKKELEYLKPFAEKEFNDPELKELAKQLITAGEKRLKAFDNWDTDLYRTALDNLAANGDRVEALIGIDNKFPIQVESEDAKDLLQGYKEFAANGLQQRIYDTAQVSFAYDSGEQITYDFTITNDTDDMIEAEYIMPILGGAINRNGDYVGELYGNGPSSLRPGQSGTGTILIPKELGDIRNCWME